MKIQQAISFRDWSRGVIRTVQSAICPPNSFRLGLNLDSNEEIGSVVSRKGTDIVGVQSAGTTCYGLHYHRDSVATNHKLFGVFSNGVTNDIYDMSDGTLSLAGDTQNRKTRFCTYLNSTVRINGYDIVKSYNGSAWVDTGGTFDEADMPKGNVVIEWHDRIWTAGVATSPSIIYYSTVADPDARTISWTVTADDPDSAGYIEVEQEDGGGGITALSKVPGYLMIFKERSMKRWDGSSTFPDDLVGMGAPHQEAVCQGREFAFFANQQGVWVTNGGYPKKISKPIEDLWNEIDTDNIAMHCDEEDVYVYVGDITLNQNTYSNICFKYNLDSQSWNVYSYAHDFTCFAWYIDGQKVIVGGDKDGQAIQLNTGNTDYPSVPISYSLETQDLEFGAQGRYKEISEMVAFTRNLTAGQIHYRSNSESEKDWKSIGNITNDVENREFKCKGNWFNFKISGVTDSGPVKIQGFVFPENSINIVENVKE